MDHFSIPLWVSSFSADPKKLVSELKSLKRTVRFYYNDVPARELWKNILQYRRKELPNLSLLVELVVSIAVNNSFVESIFSFLTAMLSDCRLCLRHETTANFLVIRANTLPGHLRNASSCSTQQWRVSWWVDSSWKSLALNAEVIHWLLRKAIQKVSRKSKCPKWTTPISSTPTSRSLSLNLMMMAQMTLNLMMTWCLLLVNCSLCIMTCIK